MGKWLKGSKDNTDAENVKGKEEPELMPSSSSKKCQWQNLKSTPKKEKI